MFAQLGERLGVSAEVRAFAALLVDENRTPLLPAICDALRVLVDRLEGQQDTVIKAIQGPVASVRGIAGATELGSQDAVLVLDVSALVEDALRGREGLQ